MAVAQHRLGQQDARGYRESWFLRTLGVEPQVWSQAPTAQSGKDYVRKGRLYSRLGGPGALQRAGQGVPVKETAHMLVGPAARQPEAWAPNRDAHLQCFSTSPSHSYPPKPNTKTTLSLHPLWTVTGPGPELQGSHWTDGCPPELRTLHTQSAAELPPGLKSCSQYVCRP